MNDTETIRKKVSLHDLKTILYYFPEHIMFKAEPTIFCKYFPPYENKDIEIKDFNRIFHELSEHEFEHHTLIRHEFTNVYSVNPEFKSTFKLYYREEKRHIMEDISHEIWSELEEKALTWKIKED